MSELASRGVSRVIGARVSSLHFPLWQITPCY